MADETTAVTQRPGRVVLVEGGLESRALRFFGGALGERVAHKLFRYENLGNLQAAIAAAADGVPVIELMLYVSMSTRETLLMADTRQPLHVQLQVAMLYLGDPGIALGVRVWDAKKIVNPTVSTKWVYRR